MGALWFPLDAVITRLQTVAAIKQLGQAPDQAAALATAPRAAPAVFLTSETVGGEIQYSGTPIQQGRDTQLRLTVWVRNHGNAAAVRAEMQALLAAIDTRFAGWTPGDAFVSPRFVASRDEFAHAQYLVVQVIYESSWDFCAEVQP